MVRSRRWVGQWTVAGSGVGLAVVVMALGSACRPVRTALRPYEATPIGAPRVRAIGATPAAAAGVASFRPAGTPHTIYVVASPEQAGTVTASLVQLGAPADGTTTSVVVLPDHEPFVPQPPDYVPATPFTIVDLRP
jgi:hypothetical protein